MTLKERLAKTKKGLRAWHQERTIFETTNLMCKVMEEERITRSELARRMGSTKGHISQLLDGTANMTLRTVSDVFLALGREFHPSESRVEQAETSRGASFAFDVPEFSTSSTFVVSVEYAPVPGISG